MDQPIVNWILVDVFWDWVHSLCEKNYGILVFGKDTSGIGLIDFVGKLLKG